MALPMFALTLFVSAFLLFMVQPIIGKLILPNLGGTPQVWNTCMVFFQAALLAGYAYTHTVSSRLNTRRQLMIHGLLLFVPLVVLFILFAEPFSVKDFRPTPGANPIPDTLFYLMKMVGLPFFVVATTAPLLQKWFTATGHPASKDPYFLYGASNLGSMLALLAYPFVIEPYLRLPTQSLVWSYSYVLLLVMVLLCAYLVWQSMPAMRLAVAPAVEGPPASMEPASIGITANPPLPAAESASTAIKKAPKFPGKPQTAEAPAGQATDELTTFRKLRWVALAAVPSSLMLGITTHITTDLSPIPLFWLVPLTLYLLSFILVFSRWPVVWTEKPHQFMLNLHPAALCLMIFIDFAVKPTQGLEVLIFFLVLGFFWTAMVCHGELARDRPSPRHLTEFYLLMSVGGVVGGVFNGLVAPMVFLGVWELPIALFFAGLVRPTLKDGGWTDDLIANMGDKPAPQSQPKKHHKQQPRSLAKTGPLAKNDSSIHYSLDIALPLGILILVAILVYVLPTPIRALSGGQPALTVSIMFGIPLIICCFYYARPLRFGLGIGAVLLIHLLYTSEGGGVVIAARTYFGVIKVFQNVEDRGKHAGNTYTRLLHGTTLHGLNYKKPQDSKKQGDPDSDFSRLATTYYHVQGPAGRAMDRFNWFKDENNRYRSDARMPASLIGMGSPLLGSNLPVEQLTGLWSEPPYATIGLGTGTMASYARPFQHAHFYEIDNVIRRLSLPVGGLDNYFTAEKAQKAGGIYYFNYLQEALNRGAAIQVLMGDARQRMDQKYQNYYEQTDKAGGPKGFYQLLVVDAFSSDAIPVHLITKQAIEMYFDHLTPDGILCVHTSNRHLDLVKVVADVAESITMPSADGTLKPLVCRLGHDRLEEDSSKSTSEWVMVARHQDILNQPRRDLGSFIGLDQPENYLDKLRDEYNRKNLQFDAARLAYWQTPEISFSKRYLWTDDYSNLLRVLK